MGWTRRVIQIDYDHCKGCMICRHECPVLAISEEKETRAW
jgi:Pyruvate/2-oxoacid:ferredoxin oxidoreductase delta subunit